MSGYIVKTCTILLFLSEICALPNWIQSQKTNMISNSKNIRSDPATFPHKRQKRYVLHGSRWKVNPVTYNISKYPPANVLSSEMVDKEIDAAFHMWEDVSNISFKREQLGKVNIDIRFEKGPHGDEEPFDGRGGMTAHAYYPYYGGNIHFDADEHWTSKSHAGVNLFQVATHEIGHALGLEHTDSKNRTVMSAYYINYDVNFRLQKDDIEGIQKLYGRKSFDLCDYSKIDAAVTMVDGSIYLFKGNLVYKMANTSSPVDPGFPKEISTVFESLHGPIDAAFTRSNGVTYIFKGNQFFRVTNMTMDVDFPKPVADFFPNIPTPVDAAVVFPSDDNIYFIKEWSGLPSSIDAAVRVQESGQPAIYFFQGQNVWKFNDRSSSVYISDPPYPRSIESLLSKC